MARSVRTKRFSTHGVKQDEQVAHSIFFLKLKSNPPFCSRSFLALEKYYYLQTNSSIVRYFPNSCVVREKKLLSGASLYVPYAISSNVIFPVCVHFLAGVQVFIFHLVQPEPASPNKIFN